MSQLSVDGEALSGPDPDSEVIGPEVALGQRDFVVAQEAIVSVADMDGNLLVVVEMWAIQRRCANVLSAKARMKRRSTKRVEVFF